ncbi:MAG: hypothetical protein Kow006_33550 [Gammaproteobacteria bacterium]
MTGKAIHRASGATVTPEEFIRREGPQYRDKGIYPECIVCGSVLHPYGVNSTNVTARFDHPDRTDCLLSSTPNPRYIHLQPSDWDLAAGKRLRETICRLENIKQAYAVCRALCFNHLKVPEFLEMFREGDRKRIWAYKGLQEWVAPYILVTLVDLEPNGKRRFPLRFVLRKPARQPIDAMWVSPEDCALEPVFADSGRPMARDPIVLSDDRIEAARADTAWIPDVMTKRLKECCAHR